jgi:hypothetical protein
VDRSRWFRNGATGGIVWTVEYAEQHHALPSYDGTNLANELYNTQQNATRDALGRGTVFAVPTVIDGRVCVVAVDHLNVYGLLQ